MEKKTPLYDAHVRHGGKMVAFGGYLLPVQYGAGLVEEHRAVRTACGLFDVSHMGEITLKGADAEKNLNRLLTNDFAGMAPQTARYSPMCNEQGGTVDDLIVYKRAENDYLLVVNASNKDKDYAWMQAQVTGDAALRDVSDAIALLALQGPRAREVIVKLMCPEDMPEKSFTFREDVLVAGVPCLLSATGYTGEDGYELYFPAEHANRLWEAILEAGAEFGILPCGLGARDTLRLEASLPLYGHELSEEVTPREAGLGFFVKMDKEDFIGKAALLDRGAPARRRVGLRVTGRGIIREQMPLFIGGEEVGMSTSGTHCPFLGEALAMAMVDVQHAEIGTRLEADVRGRRVEAEIVKMPFYKKLAK